MRLSAYALSTFLGVTFIACQHKPKDNTETTTENKIESESGASVDTANDKTVDFTNAQPSKEETPPENVIVEPSSQDKNNPVTTEQTGNKASEYEDKKIDLDDTASEALKVVR